MRLLSLLCLALVLTGNSAAAQHISAPEVPELQVDVGPTAAIRTNGYQTGQLVLSVKLLSRHPFEALDLKLPQISDAEVIELTRPRTRRLNGYAGDGFVFETSVAVFPRTNGILEIGPVTAIGHVEPDGRTEVPFDLASAPIEVKIAAPSDHFKADWWLVSERIEIDETWSVPPEEIRAGEIVQRTVSLRAWGVPAYALPELTHGRTRGIGVSLAQSERGTEKSSDGLIATATFVWDLQAEQVPVAFIAPVGVDFWDPLAHRPRKAAVPGMRLEPLPADSAIQAKRLMQAALSEHRQTQTLGLIALVALAIPIFILLATSAWTWLPSLGDRRLSAALRDSRSPAEMYVALQVWLSERRQAMRTFSDVSVPYKQLSSHLFSPRDQAEPSAAALTADALRFARRERRDQLLDALHTLW